VPPQLALQLAAQVAAQLAAQEAAQLAAQVALQVALQVLAHEPLQLFCSVNSLHSPTIDSKHFQVRVTAPPAALSNSVSVRLRIEVWVKPNLFFFISSPFLD